MPVLETPDYHPALPFRNGDIATLYPPLFRPTPVAESNRERIETPDGDFLNLDHHPCRTGASRKLAVISHGLEGHSRKKYMLGMAIAATMHGHDAVCWNQRGCGGEYNRLARGYHSGETDDLHTVITHCLACGAYEEVVLIGFSMGGNQILKYLGENPARIPAQVRQAAVFSVPCDLAATERVIAKPRSRIYLEYFMRGLRRTVREKGRMFPDQIDPTRLDAARTLRDFDDMFTAPINGFRDADDYYARSSCKQFLRDIRIPALLVNALDDPFLPEACYPTEEARNNPNLQLEMPRYGGHVGFVHNGQDNVYWSEQRVGALLARQGS